MSDDTDRHELMEVPHSSHWGAFTALVENGRLVGVRPFSPDPDPSPLLMSIPDALYHTSRVAAPAIRGGWLHHGPRRSN